jgi:hypothetical protein
VFTALAWAALWPAKEKMNNMIKRHAVELKAANKIGGRSAIMSIEGVPPSPLLQRENCIVWFLYSYTNTSSKEGECNWEK